jgi:hypothetical protein
VINVRELGEDATFDEGKLVAASGCREGEKLKSVLHGFLGSNSMRLFVMAGWC